MRLPTLRAAGGSSAVAAAVEAEAEPVSPDRDEAERNLFQGVRAGDEQALRVLFESYWAPLASYAATILGEVEECQDVALQVFVRVWQHRGELDCRRAVRPYLYRIARNLARNALRDRRLREERQRSAEGPAERSLHLVDPSERLMAASLKAEVEAAIEQLPERRREAFVLSRFQGLSHGEIADTLGISPQTVANQISAALSDLQTSLADHLDRS